MINGCASFPDSYWGTIRNLLQYLGEHNITDRDFSPLVPRKKAPIPLPTFYTKEERHQLEMAPERTISLEKRDYAIILLINRLGLRCSDVTHLTFSALDTEKKLIKLSQYKTENDMVLPLLPEIEEAINDYVENARPESDSNIIFLSSRAPYQQMASPAIHGIYTKYLRKASIDIAGRKHGGHAFRSSLTISMVNNGISYEVARRILGHAGKGSIRYYASLDVAQLRKCALRVHPATGNFKNLIDAGMCIVKW